MAVLARALENRRNIFREGRLCDRLGRIRGERGCGGNQHQ
jgi:hypothetical protein